jgi:adenylate cyclase
LAREAGDIRAILNGALIGLFGGVFIWVFEMKVFYPKNRTLTFIPVFLIKTLAYFIGFFVIILTVKALIDSMFYKKPVLGYITSNEFLDFILKEDFDIILIYTLAFLAVINFTIQISRKVGYDMMINYITGKYHSPKTEQRIFMFIDLKSSTTIAKIFGDEKYHRFLNDFYFDVTKCILATKGEIYRYVGDEIDITWHMHKGLRSSNCIRTYFYVLYQINREKEKYLEKYGIVPQFTACLHGGNVTTGEIGAVKSQIIHYGKVIQETALLKDELKRLNKSFLITENLIQEVNIPPAFQAINCGTLERMDKSNDGDLYTIVETE